MRPPMALADAAMVPLDATDDELEQFVQALTADIDDEADGGE